MARPCAFSQAKACVEYKGAKEMLEKAIEMYKTEKLGGR